MKEITFPTMVFIIVKILETKLYCGPRIFGYDAFPTKRGETHFLI